MSKIKVLIHSPHVLFDDDGHPMSMGHVYNVTNGTQIQNYLVEGLATVVEAASESEQKEKQEKVQPNKTMKPETASANPQENSNG
jgi:hypothetical protein